MFVHATMLRTEPVRPGWPVLTSLPPACLAADAREEEARRDAQFDYYPSSCHALGFGYRPLEIVGEVPDPLYVPPPPPEEQLPPSTQALSPVRPAPSDPSSNTPANPPSPTAPQARNSPLPAMAASPLASPPTEQSHPQVAAQPQPPSASAAGPAGGVQAHPSPTHAKLPTTAGPTPPPPPQRQHLEAASERLRKHLLDLQPSVVYLQVAVAAAVALLLLWQRGKRRPGSPLISPRSGISRQSSLPTHTVRSPRASPVKS